MQSLRKQKSVIELALKITQILERHPDRIEAACACTVARELLSLHAPSGIFLGSTANKGLHKKGVSAFIHS